MPTREEHLIQASRNEDVALLLQTDYPDWAVTALFYAALHYVEAYFSINAVKPDGSSWPQHYSSHVERLKGVRERLPALFAHYELLLTRSIDARYDCQNFTTTHVQELRRRRLDPIKQLLLFRR